MNRIAQEGIRQTSQFLRLMETSHGIAYISANRAWLRAQQSAQVHPLLARIKRLGMNM